MNTANREKQFCTRRVHASFVEAFTFTELLVVIAILALFAATQLPALTGGKAPVNFTQCMNNLRQIGQATMLYTADNAGRYPYQQHQTLFYPADPGSWTRQLLQYMANSTNKPAVYRCPSESRIASYGVFDVHYWANQYVIAELDFPRPTSSQIKKPSIYWLFIEKDPNDLLHVSAGGLLTSCLGVWNQPPGYLGLRRHSGGFAATACDGHVKWLRPPPYRPGAPTPQNFGELGDTSDGYAQYWADNGLPKKLYCRKFPASGDAISF